MSNYVNDALILIEGETFKIFNSSMYWEYIPS